MDLRPEEEIKFLGQPLAPLAHSQLADATERLEARHAVVGISPQFEIDAANLEGPPAPQIRQEVLLELRLGMKVQITLHRPDPEGPVVASLRPPSAAQGQPEAHEEVERPYQQGPGQGAARCACRCVRFSSRSR